MISAAQCRSACALLGWSVAKLATAASVSASAIDDFEAERRAPLPAVAGPIRRAFEPVGVAFLPGEDVRLRPRALFRSWRRLRPHSRATALQKPRRLTASNAGPDPSVE
jgi:transcriptional regulator with XRE-family HTH domain